MRRIFIIVTSIVRLVKSAARATLDAARSVAYNPRVMASCGSLFRPFNLTLDLEEMELAMAVFRTTLTLPSEFLWGGYCQTVAIST
jgi:hypothetical protein